MTENKKYSSEDITAHNTTVIKNCVVFFTVLNVIGLVILSAYIANKFLG